MDKPVYLITGPPGSGKTSLVKQALVGWGGRVGGFYTEEVRHQGVRQGFSLVTLKGERAVLAHTQLPGPPWVGKYGVDVAALDRVGVAALHQALGEGALVVIDEIGKMELFSAAFREAVLRAVEGGGRVLATVMLSPHPFADALKKDPRVRLLHLTRPSFPAVLQEVKEWLSR